ncbi:histidinol-phosphatase HisJ family protein [Butyrivibrio sp. VCB2006]|uniref:histidinol-phosphatase HisJ family protein n=1 Tax=Butyrivibrio sp. VCB2006 TaxID=1280679 RepID=UPI000413BBC6|nr:histidinol-phosphatase HisJ family protein [Butyrivibrio sp. VCB2006]
MSFLPADYHLHTHNSGDSEAPMKDMVESAISKGLTEMCFTEHMDLDFPITEQVPEGLFTLDIPPYEKDLFSYREEYKDRIAIKYGIELGLQPQILADNKAIIQNHGFDFVIGSVHLLDHKDPYYYSNYWSAQDEDSVIRRYFESTLENIKLFSDFDVLGHLDYIVRYTPSKGADYSYFKYKDIIDEILSLLIEMKKGLDLNTKALVSGNENPNPGIDILKRYHELGGRIITFGSDAHVPDGVAGCFDKAKDIALKCGFDSYYTFTKRVPCANTLN